MLVKLIQCFEDLKAIADRNAPIVVAFTGGVDSTYILLWLWQNGFTDIHAVHVDLKAPMEPGELDKQKAAAEHFGAKFVTLDGAPLFIEKAVIPAILAQACYLGNFPISSSLSRTIIAKLLVLYAKTIGAKVILHTANKSQNSMERLNNGFVEAGHTGFYGSPYTLDVIPREQKVKALAEADFQSILERITSGDKNVLCNEFEGGKVDNPRKFVVPRDAWIWTSSSYTPRTFELKLGFKNGLPVTVDDREMALIDIISKLNTVLGEMGIGRYTGLEHILHGTKHEAAVLEIREAPAMAAFIYALNLLISGSLCSDEIVLLRNDQQSWALAAAAGLWGRSLHKACGERIAAAMKTVGGSVTFIVSFKELQPCSIMPEPENDICVTDRDEWEIAHVKNITGN